MIVKIKKLNDNAKIPQYAHPGVDMGMDVVATSIEYKEDIDCYVYHTGLAFEVPEGYGMLIFPRSSNRKTDAYLSNSVGVLDSSYRGELLVCFKNRDSFSQYERINLLTSKLLHVAEDIQPEDLAPYKVGDRIAQIIIFPYPQIEFEEVNELSNTDRGDGGFGSTGSN